MALAAAYLAHRDPSAIMIALPSDHLLSDGEQWQRTVRLACEAAEGGALVTVGLKPTAPETGYGYIRSGRELPGLADGDIRVHTVAQFVEKPDPETAREYLADGRYLWNSGMLVACATTVLSQLRSVGRRQVTPESSHGEQIAETAEWLAQLPPEKWHDPEAIERFGALPAVQFDKAVLEISERVAVVPTELDWSDVGSLLSLACLEQPDERGNVLVGNVQDVDSSGVIAYSADRLVATLGLHDVVVVDTADATLVADKNRTQDVRAVVERLREAGAPELIANRESLRPWGSWTSLLKGDAYHIKSIVVRPGQRLSLQSHENRSEHWVVISGTAEVERDGEMFTVQANESAFIPSGSKHRLSNPGDEPLRVIEVAVGDYLEEDDIVRYDDDWGR